MIRPTLRAKLTLALLSVWLPVAVGAAVVFGELDREMRARIGSRLDEVDRALTDALDRERARLDAAVQTMLSDPVDRTLPNWAGTPPEALTSQLDLRSASAPGVEILSVIDWELEPGGVVVYSRHLPADVGFPPPRWVQRRAGDGYAPVLVRSRGGHPPSPVPALVRVVTVPGPDGSPRLGVVAGTRLDGAWLVELARLAKAQILLEGPGLDRAVPVGDSTPAPPAPTRTQRLSGIVPGRFASMELRVDPGPWVRIRRQFGRWSLGALCVSAAVALVGAWLMARRLGQPVAELSEAARRVGRGDLDARVQPRSRDEVGELGRRFNDMVDELAQTRSRLARAERVAAWREVARRVAHEVKNPLSPIRMAVENMRRSVRGQHPDTLGIVERSTDAVLAEVASIDRLVSEFSSFARMPTPRLAPTEWASIIDELIARYQGSFDGVALSRAVQLPPGRASSVDREQMIRALSNLVKNAGEALAGRPGRIELAAAAVPGGVEVSVTDDGPGLPGNAADAFAPYATTKPEGTGLGLAIVEHVAVEHGGEVRYEPVTPHGARFTIFVPDR